MSTARLKRKLEDADVGNLNESFVTYGTPLPSLADTKKDKNEFVPLWKQEVKDEKGRRRFHGAFTGGFSAGYYNTVGSEEGWTPSTFVSSKYKKDGAKPGEQSMSELALKYMDEEDISDLSASRKLQQTSTFNETYDPLSGLGGPTQNTVESALFDLIRPAKNSIGVELIKKMGWKEGTGVGPRVSLKRRREQAVDYGLVKSGQILEDEDEEMEDHQGKKKGYAPLNRPLFNFDKAANEGQRGLGWTREENMSERMGREGMGATTTNSKSEEGKKKMPVGGAWGLGALEEADRDDMDVYDDQPEQQSNMMVVEEDEDSTIVVLGSLDARKREKERKERFRKENERNRKVQASELFRDGTLVPTGFVLAKVPEKQPVWPAPPPIPKDWKPNPQAIWDRDPTRKFGIEDQAKNDKSRPVNLTADQRGEMYGEQKLPETKKSVFDYISSANKARIEAVKASHGSGKTGGGPLERVIIPELDPKTAAQALKGFIPFADDKSKQSRYMIYLQVMSGARSRSEVTFMPVTKKDGTKQTIEELNRELMDFEKSAKVFKPMSGMMANRFTSSKEVLLPGGVEEGERKVGLYQPTEEDRKKTMERAEKGVERLEVEETPMQNAARMGMWGPLTREVKNFYPDRLLCKRFGVQDPHPEGPVQEAQSSRMDEMLLEKGFRPIPQPSAAEKKEEGSTFSITNLGERRTLANVGLGEDETQGADTLTYKRPSMDIFKAIFADDDSDDDSDEEEDEDEGKMKKSGGDEMKENPPVVDKAFKDQVDELLKSEGQRKSVEVKNSTNQPLGPTNELGAFGEEEIKVVDVSFRPTFISRKQRNESKDKETKEKRSKKKKTALSFDVEDVEDGDVGPSVKPKKRKKEKEGGEKEHRKKKRKEAEEVEEMDEWVEKAPALPPTPNTSAMDDRKEKDKAVVGHRMRAIDLME